jgi:hypothetical protein
LNIVILMNIILLSVIRQKVTLLSVTLLDDILKNVNLINIITLSVVLLIVNLLIVILLAILFSVILLNVTLIDDCAKSHYVILLIVVRLTVVAPSFPLFYRDFSHIVHWHVSCAQMRILYRNDGTVVLYVSPLALALCRLHTACNVRTLHALNTRVQTQLMQ